MASQTSLKTIWEGDYGLPKTFWFGLGILVVYGRYLLDWLSAMAGPVIPALAMLAYAGAWTVATFRASSRYTGPNGWVWASRAFLFLLWFSVLSIFHEGYSGGG